MREVAQVAEDVHHGCGGDAVGRGGVQASVRSRGAELELSCDDANGRTNAVSREVGLTMHEYQHVRQGMVNATRYILDLKILTFPV